MTQGKQQTMRPPEIKTTEATVNFGPRPSHVETLGVVSKVPLGTVNGVTANPTTGDVVFSQTNYTLITELGFDHLGYDKARKQELSAHITAIKTEIDRYQTYYAELWQLVFKSGYFENGYSFATGLILKKGFFQTPKQVNRLAEDCKLFLDCCVMNFEDPVKQKQAEEKYKELSAKFFDHVATLIFYYKIARQLYSEDKDIKWDPEIVEMMPATTVISIFFIKDFNHFTFRKLIHLNGDKLLQKLSREDIIFIAKNCPTIGHSTIKNVFTAIVTTPELCNKLSIEDFSDIIHYYSKPKHGGLNDYFAEVLLGATHTLDLALKKPKLLAEILPLIPFHELQLEKLDKHYAIDPHGAGTSILEHIKQHISVAKWQLGQTATLWKPVARASLFQQKDALLMLRDEKICSQMAVEDIVELITSSGGSCLADKQERMAIYFQHPAPSDVFILPELPNNRILERNETYKLHYIYIEGERQLYYIEANGLCSRMYYEDAERSFKIDGFIEQLAQLKQEQGTTEKVHLTKENIQRMIIDNSGVDYTSAGVLRLTEACGQGYWVKDGDLKAELQLEWIYQDFSEYRNPDIIYSGYRHITEKLMENFEWHRGNCHLTYRKLHDKPALQIPELRLDLEQDSPLKHNQDGKAVAVGSPVPTTWNNTQKAALSAGLTSAALGTLGLILLEAGALSSAAGPYVWPLSLSLTIVGGLLLAGLSLYTFCGNQGLFGDKHHYVKLKSEDNPSISALPSH